MRQIAWNIGGWGGCSQKALSPGRFETFPSKESVRAEGASGVSRWAGGQEQRPPATWGPLVRGLGRAIPVQQKLEIWILCERFPFSILAQV